ncbi:MAG TPA: nucleotidyltransferase domain-containing protein [Thermodesulfovibrionales bacterium]|nr:nucleotidyltransferase domain-containing protein [Thermodesulfovibrionales bacterium]
MNNSPTFTLEEHKALTELKEGIKGLLGERMIKMVIYGSRARGDYEEESDIDIAIIVQGLTRELKGQIFNIVADIELKYLMPFSTLVLSEEQFESLRKRERRIAIDIEREGVPI